MLASPGRRQALPCLACPHEDEEDSFSLRMTLFALQSMVGSDIAELLMQDCKKLEKYKRQPPVANLINLTDDSWPVPSSGTPNLLTGEIPPSVETPAQIVEKFTKLLYYGRKKASAPPADLVYKSNHCLSPPLSPPIR